MYDPTWEGHISTGNLRNLLFTLGQPCSKQEVDDFMKEFDKHSMTPLQYQIHDQLFQWNQYNVFLIQEREELTLQLFWKFLFES